MSFEVIPAPAGFQSRRRTATPTQIIVHESVTTTLDGTISVLRRRGLGAHLCVAPDGRVFQWEGFDRVVSHAGALNGASVGIEVVNPYYPTGSRPWSKVIPARWAHRGHYVVPTEAQLDALYEAIRHVLATEDMAAQWPGAVGGRFAMARVPGALKAPGIQAHTYTAHADGGFPVLYAFLRHAGAAHEEAYSTALRLATNAGAWVTLPGGLHA